MASSRSIVIAALGLVLAACGLAVAADATPRPLWPVVAYINTNTPPPTRAQAVQGGNRSAAVAAPTDSPGVGATAIATATQTTTPMPTPSSKTVNRSAAVKELTNQVFTRANVNAAEQSAALGQIISVGGSVRTLDNSKARIDLTEGTIVRLAPLTSFTVSALNTDAVNPLTQLQLLFGKIWIILKGGTLDVQTPVGVASVRGSYMSVAYSTTLLQTIITCLEGQCSVLFNNVRLLMTDAEQITIPFPGHVGGIDPFEIRDWLDNNPESASVIPTNTPTLLPPPPTATNTPVPPTPVTASNTPTVTATASDTPTATVTHTRTVTVTASNTPTVTATASDTPPATVTHTRTVTVTASNTPTATVTQTRTVTVTASDTPTATVTHTRTVTVTASDTPTAIVTASDTPTATVTQTPTVTATPAGLVVNSTADGVDANVGDGVCLTVGGVCTLRAAIQEANAPGATLNTITFACCSTYILTLPGAGENAAITGDLDILKSMTIAGNGATTTIIDGGGLDRVFDIAPGITLTLSAVTIQNGDAAADNGGGILNAGTLNLSDAIVTGSTAANGGGIANGVTGTATLNNVTISSNTATTGHGGGLYNENNATLSSVTVSGNTANAGFGGGIKNFGTATTLTLTNSTIGNGNTADIGGGIATDGTATISGTTIKGNTATSDGGGIWNNNTLTVTTSTVNGNTADSDLDGIGNGGGLLNDYGATLSLTGSTVSNNQAQDGGGITNNSTLTLTTVTLNGNKAKNNGGGAINVGTMTIVNSTVSGNAADSDLNGSGEGGGIYHGGGTANLSFVTITNNNAGGTSGVGGLASYVSPGAGNVKNSIIADQTAPHPNCGGTVNDMGGNFDSDGTCTGFTNSGAGVLLEPTLSGGPPTYHLLQAGSPAKDVIATTPTNNCTTITGDSASPAENGQTRPTNPNCDAGAVEMP